ncbi:hypothetical protein C8R43DRAFT_1009052, partial [Mycena crocata]
MVAGYWSTHFSIRTRTKSKSNSASAYIEYTKFMCQHTPSIAFNSLSTVNRVARRNYAQIAPAMLSLQRAPPTSIKYYYHATANAFFKSDVCLPSTKACSRDIYMLTCLSSRDHAFLLEIQQIGLKQRRNYIRSTTLKLWLNISRIQDSFILQDTLRRKVSQVRFNCNYGHCSIFRLALRVQPFSLRTAVVCMYVCSTQLYALQQFRTSPTSSQYPSVKY